MHINIHRVTEVKIRPLETNNGSTWQTIVVTDVSGHEFELTLFPNNGCQLLAPTVKS